MYLIGDAAQRLYGILFRFFESGPFVRIFDVALLAIGGKTGQIRVAVLDRATTAWDAIFDEIL